MSLTKHMTAGLLSAVDEKRTEKPPRQKKSAPSLPRHNNNNKNNNLFTTMFRWLRNELDVTERLLRSNGPAFCFIFLGGLLSRVIRAPLPSQTELAMATAKTLALGLLCSYLFDICNQATSPEEDALNKPYRPIPAGLLTVDQARTRWYLVWTVAPLVMHHFFGVWAMVHMLWFEVLITYCYVWPRWFDWYMRNCFASTAYFIEARLLNEVLLARGSAPRAWDLSVFVEVGLWAWFMATIHVQEFHDLEGDRKSDRKTLPMLLSLRGLQRLRAGTSLFMLASGAALAFAGCQKMDQDVFITGPVSVLQLMASGVVAYRVCASTSPEMDKVTYLTYYYFPPLLILISLSLVTK